MVRVRRWVVACGRALTMFVVGDVVQGDDTNEVGCRPSAYFACLSRCRAVMVTRVCVSAGRRAVIGDWADCRDVARRCAVSQRGAHVQSVQWGDAGCQRCGAVVQRGAVCERDGERVRGCGFCGQQSSDCRGCTLPILLDAWYSGGRGRMSRARRVRWILLRAPPRHRRPRQSKSTSRLRRFTTGRGALLVPRCRIWYVWVCGVATGVTSRLGVRRRAAPAQSHSRRATARPVHRTVALEPEDVG